MGKRKASKKRVARRTSRTKKKTAARPAKKKTTARSSEPIIVRARGKPLARDLIAGKRARPMPSRRKLNLLKRAAPRMVAAGLWDYAYLTARQPWIENVARLAVVDAAMRSNPNDFMLTASDGNYHAPYAGVYFRAATANVPILVNFIVNALRQQTVRTQAGGKVQEATLAAGFHHVSIIVVPPRADLQSAILKTQRGNPRDALLELGAVELTTLR